MIPDSPATPGRRALRVLVGLVGLIGAHVAEAGILAAQFAVSPVIVQLAHDPAGTATLLRVDNEGEDVMQFRVYAADFDQDRDGEHHFAAAGTLQRSCAERLRFAPDALTVPAGSGAVVRVSLEAGTDPTCWSMLFVEAPSAGTGAIRVNQRIGVKIYGLGAEPGADGELVSATVQPAGDSVEVAFTFRNPGDWPLRPSGAVEIRDAGGAVITTAPVPAFSVLPGHERLLRVSLPLESAGPGRYLAVPILDFGADYLAGAQADFRIEL